MRGFLVMLSLLVGLLWAGYAAVRANADTGVDQFLDEVHMLGWYGKTAAGDGDLIRNGYIVCGIARQGFSVADIAHDIYVGSGFDVTYVDAAAFTATAVANLCPDAYRGPNL